MRFAWAWTALGFGLATLQGCSCQSLPDVVEEAAGAGGNAATGGGGSGAGGEAGVGGGEQCGDEMVDVMSDSRHCGLCDNACVGMRPCVGGSCLLAGSGDGAFAVAMDSEEDEFVYWSHGGLGGAIERVSRFNGATDEVAGMFLLWDLQVHAGYLGIIPMTTGFATGAPQWLTWGGVPTDVCPGTCIGYDVLVSGEILAYGTDRDIYVQGDGMVIDLTGPPDFPVTLIAASAAMPNPVAMGGDVGTAPFDNLRFAPALTELATPVDLNEIVVRLPNALTFVGQDLYWIGDRRVRCRRGSDGQIIDFLTWRRPGEDQPRQPFALWVAWSGAMTQTPLLYVSHEGGSIVRVPANCQPQTAVEVLVEPPLEADADVFAITGPTTADGPIYYSMSSADNANYGGVFARHRMARVLRTD